MARTLYDKIWDEHVVHTEEDGTAVLYIDRHLVHEVTSPQAFEGLRMTGRKVRHPEKTLAVVDHNVPTTLDRANAATMTEDSRIQVAALDKNAKEEGVKTTASGLQYKILRANPTGAVAFLFHRRARMTRRCAEGLSRACRTE